MYHYKRMLRFFYCSFFFFIMIVIVRKCLGAKWYLRSTCLISAVLKWTKNPFFNNSRKNPPIFLPFFIECDIFKGKKAVKKWLSFLSSNNALCVCGSCRVLKIISSMLIPSQSIMIMKWNGWMLWWWWFVLLLRDPVQPLQVWSIMLQFFSINQPRNEIICRITTQTHCPSHTTQSSLFSPYCCECVHLAAVNRHTKQLHMRMYPDGSYANSTSALLSFSRNNYRARSVT